MRSVLLVAMPFGALDRPALGLSLLAAGARERGRRCDVAYLTFPFAGLVGVDDYTWVESSVPYEAFAGEWLFAEALLGPRPEADAGYLDEVIGDRYRLGGERHRLVRARTCATHFVESCRTLVPWGDYDVVGFTSTFQQNLASLAMAARVKHDHPETTIVFGGANWEGEMGEALMRRFPFVDIACSGEADESFPAVLAAIDGGRPPDGVPGVTHRVGGSLMAGPPARRVEDLDSLPVPDFSAFFAALDNSPSGLGILPRLLVETARGCWWGAHDHCTFCGLNGASLGFRSKSPDRALAEFRTLHARHGIPNVSVVDNILDMRYVRTVLPALESEGPELDLFWEVKANLSNQQVRQLAGAGVRHIQPGIESMSDDVLERLRKGTTLIRNVELLKWAREHGVTVEWNLLFGAPGESPGDYTAMAELFPKLTHLDPPGACGPIRLDRFSPYHADPAAFGMTNVRAMAPYRYLYDVGVDELDRIAYYFDFDYDDGREPAAYAWPAVVAAQQWRSVAHQGGLWAIERPDGALVIVDERPGRRRRTSTITGWKAAAYRACDRALSREELVVLPELDGVDAGELDRFLARCAEVDVMLLHDGRYLGLAVHCPPRRASDRVGRRIPVAVGHG